MKRAALFASLMLAVPAASGLVIAQTAGPPAKAAAPAATTATAPAGHDHDHGPPSGQHEEMMCGKMMGGGMGPMMMGGGMMGGGMGPMMMGSAAKIAVKNVDKGVTMTFTSDDAATVARLRKMAEAMRLMHEAMASER